MVPDRLSTSPARDARPEPEGGATAAAGRAGEARLLAGIRRLSGGRVRSISASGPVLAAAPGPARRARRGTFVPALRRADRLTIAFFSAGWAVCLAAFWAWWLQPGHLATRFGLVVNSLVLLYISFFPVFYPLTANRLRTVDPAAPVPPLRVAFAVTKAPSEPWDLARTTLSAMLAQDIPLRYDVWLCDEQPEPEAVAWCQERGVRISTRRAAPGYHRATWPRRARCKEGNLAYFYDHWGYRDYDAVAQLDCDHVPSPGYLAEMIRPFGDPAIGYVAAPSVCDANGAWSWAARGRVRREAPFHGPIQLGHNDGLAPACIGSHYAVRTAALAQIGGLGPELAEDFSTTFLLSAAGWQGAFAIRAEAHGAGPNTFAAMVRQEFQWARSLTTLLLGMVPRNLRRLSWRLRLRFLYALSYYPLMSGATAIGLALAPVAVLTGQPWIRVNYFGFLAHIWSVSVWLLMLTVLLRGRGLLRPWAPVLSWESWLYSLTRWPFILLGVAAAVVQLVRPRPVTFAVTPKAHGGLEPLRALLVAPFAVIALAAAGAALAGERVSSAAGYVFLCLAEALTYAAVAWSVPVLHAREAAARVGTRVGAAVRATARPPLALAAAAGLAAAAAIALYPAYAIRLLGG